MFLEHTATLSENGADLRRFGRVAGASEGTWFVTLDQLRVFIAVAAREHVTKAAEALNMTQSAVSAAIASLEAKHDVALFNRIGRGIKLTEAGTRFNLEAIAVLRRAEEAEQVLSDLGDLVAGVLRIQASQTVGSYWLPQKLVLFRELHPAVAVRVDSGNTTSVAQAVRDGEIDLGIVEGRVGLDQLVHRVVAEDRMIVVVGHQHPWADGRVVNVANLSDSTWIMREAGSGTRQEFESDVLAMGIDPDTLKIVLEMPSNEACLAAVEGGQSATVLSSRAVASRLGPTIRKVEFELPARNFTVLWHPNRHQTRAVRAMRELLSSDR